jgi:hypothetical protein
VFAVVIHQNKGPEAILPALPVSLPNAESADANNTKGDLAAPPLRAKPDAATRPSPATPIGPEPIVPLDAPKFAVIDPSGYATGLQDYRGHIVLIGIWSADQPEAAQNLQRVYQAFGTRRELRILGVSRRNQDRLPGTTFPIVFNNGSRLLEVQNSEFVVIDKDGREQMRGSLAGDVKVLIPQIRARLDQLGSR